MDKVKKEKQLAIASTLETVLHDLLDGLSEKKFKKNIKKASKILVSGMSKHKLHIPEVAAIIEKEPEAEPTTPTKVGTMKPNKDAKKPLKEKTEKPTS